MGTPWRVTVHPPTYGHHMSGDIVLFEGVLMLHLIIHRHNGVPAKERPSKLSGREGKPAENFGLEFLQADNQYDEKMSGRDHTLPTASTTSRCVHTEM
eukprot:COSAG06_NODE_961_length_11312_cov_10.559351_4_plen_98_part_00